LKLYSQNKVIHCLCEFHVKQKINRITHDENQRRLLRNYVINNDKKNFILLINAIKETKKEERKNTIENYKNYIIKYWRAFRNMLASDVRSSMESHISHNVAKYFSYEPKAFSKRRIQKLLKLQEYKANNVNILGLYMKTCNNKEKTILRKEELNFNFLNNSSSNLPILYSEDSLTRLAISGLVS